MWPLRVPAGLLVVLVLWVGLSVGPAPEIIIRTGFDPDRGELPWLGPRSPLTITVREPRRVYLQRRGGAE